MVLEYLKILLEKYDCVILPGFGGFIGQYHAATVHPIKNTFVPPSKKVVFNASLKNQDGLLLHALVTEKQLTEVVAKEAIQQFIDAIKTDLKEKGISFLDGLGQFSYNEEHNLVFKVDGNSNFLDTSFGLPHLFVKPLVNTVMEENTSKREMQKPQQEEKSNSKKIFLIFPLVLICLGVISSILLLNKQEQQTNAASVIKEDTVSEDMSAYDVQDSYAETPKEVAEIAASQDVFHVIIGVYSKKANAELIASQQAGAQILEIGGLYKISLAQFASLEEATDSLDIFRNQFGQDLWVLKQ